MKLKIKSKQSKPFIGNTGEEINYTWYRAIRLADNVNFQFGSSIGNHPLEVELDLNVQKFLKDNGKISFKEVIEIGQS